MKVWNWMVFLCLLCGAVELAVAQVPPPPPCAPGEFLQIAIDSGNNQTGTVSTKLFSPLVVKATCNMLGVSGLFKSANKLINPVTVTWTVITGGGKIDNAAFVSKPTDSNDLSSAEFTLGPSAGSQTVTASVNGVGSVTFIATATAPPPNISIKSGNNLTGAPNTSLGIPFEVNVQEGGSPAPDGTNVIWTVTSGGGTLSNAGVTTTTGGATQNTLTLGPGGGPQTVTASVIGGNSVTFTANAASCEIVAKPSPPVIPGTEVLLTAACQPPAGGDTSYAYKWSTGETTPSIKVMPIATLDYALTVDVFSVSNNKKTGTINSTVKVVVATGTLIPISDLTQAGAPGQTFPLVVQAILSTKEPLSGQTVAWTVVGGGSVSQTESTTDSSGLASTKFTAGPLAGVQRVRASLGSLTPVEFVFNISEPTSCDITPMPSATVVQGTRVTLTANCNPLLPGTTYLWSPGGATTQSISVTPSSNTTYSVAITLPGPGAGSTISKSISVSVSAGTLAIVAGNKQAGMANSSLAGPLSVKVTDSGGAPAPGIEVTWKPSQAADVLGSSPKSTTVTDEKGIATNTLKLGPFVGSRTVSVTIPGGQSKDFIILSAEMAVVQPAQSLIGPISQAAIVAPQAQLRNINARLDELRLVRLPGVLDGLRGTIDNETVSVAMLGSLFGTVKLAAADANANVEPPPPPSKWGFFVNGDFGIDKQDSVNTYQGYKLRTDGVTVGADYRFPNNNILGGSIGYIKGDTSIDGGGSQDTTGFSFSMYGALVPSEKTYINAIGSYGHNRYKTQRITDAGDTANGSTQGNQYALSVSGGYNFTKDAFILNPYGRVDMIIATVDGFSEDSGTNPIHVSSQRIYSTVFSLGASASYTMPLSFATLIPTVRVELQQATNGSPSNVTAGLVGDPLNTSFAVPYIGQDKSYGNFGVGVLALFTKSVSATFNYEQLFGKENYSGQRFLLGVRVDLP